VAELARHWSSTNRSQDLAKALDYAWQAADAALKALAPAEALHYYSQAIELNAQVSEQDPISTLDLTIGLGTAQRQTGDPSFRDTLLDAAHRADDLGDNHRLVIAALANDRGTYTKAGSLDLEKIGILELALSRLSSNDPDRPLVLATLCQELTFGSSLERRVALAEEAMVTAERLGDQGTIVRVLNHVSDPLRVPELLEQSLARSARALALAEQLGDPVLHYWAASVRRIAAAGAGDIDEVDRCLETSRSLTERLDQPTLTWVQTYGTADRVLVAGDLDKAEQYANEALEIGTDGGEPDAIAVFGAQFVSVSSQRGTMSELIPLIEQVAAENPGIPAFVAALAGAHVEGDRIEDARELLEQFAKSGFELPMDMGWITGMVTYAEAAIQCRDPRYAGPIFEALRPWASQFSYNDVTTEGPISHFLGGLATVLGQHDAANEYFSQSASFCTTVGAKCFRARTELSWAKMLLERHELGDVDKARELLTSAQGIATTHGYGTTARRAAAELRQLARPISGPLPDPTLD
jgi:tetratricopeptide (TPR) repeat protein